MSGRIVEIRLDDERTILAEVELEPEVIVNESEGLAPVARSPQRLIELAGGTIDTAMKSVVIPLTEVLFDQMMNMRQTPSALTLEFGLQLNSQIGVSIARAEMAGNIKVTVTWNKGGEDKP